jgi:hypothetical protein
MLTISKHKIKSNKIKRSKLYVLFEYLFLTKFHMIMKTYRDKNNINGSVNVIHARLSNNMGLKILIIKCINIIKDRSIIKNKEIILMNNKLDGFKFLFSLNFIVDISIL